MFEDNEDGDNDPLANLLSLTLRKPTHWNWELSTSRSCSNIALPRILLYDHTGNLLVDADQHTEKTYRPQERRKRSATSSLVQKPKTNAAGSSDSGRLSQDFHGLRIAEATPSISPSRSRSRSSRDRTSNTGSCIDFNTNELPDWEPSCSSHRSSSLKGVRFKETSASPSAQPVPSYPTPPSTSTLTTTDRTSSSSAGPREKRRYRRSQSSILERFSMARGRHSSPEYVQEHTLEHSPRYFLRSSKAGTLMIKEDSFQRQRRRRPPRHSSSENVLLDREKDRSAVVQATTTTTKTARQRLKAQLSTSEEEHLGEAEPEQARKTNPRQSRGRRTQRSCNQDVAQELITVDPDNCVYRAAPGATAR
ncbi:uncharacterized protein Dwil_GK25568 [Drosophila willistoni]|uniref:CG15247-PA n=1 Tax=Drosophila willistoni TaxID=7260 RepID=B4NE35_DROWI|nr:uncharacterized protein LOC6649015 [Drosophila willistoni]EDW82004.1 uncharacterized protein Dwil_GK25568 [Drosophila willistoni]